MRKLYSKGPKCVEMMNEHMCDMAFPLCKTGHKLVPRLNSQCTLAFTACGASKETAQQHCDDAAHSAVHDVVAKSSNHQELAQDAQALSKCSLHHVAPKSDKQLSHGTCVNATGLQICKTMEGKNVFLNQTLFNSVQMAESYIHYTAGNGKAEYGVNTTSCKEVLCNHSQLSLWRYDMTSSCLENRLPCIAQKSDP